MVQIVSTAEMARGIYETMEVKVRAARERLGRPLTLSEKVLFGHLAEWPEDAPLPGRTSLLVTPDRVVLQDVLGQTAFLQFAQTRRPRVAVPTTVHCDHLIQARVNGDRDLLESLSESDEIYRFLRSAAAHYGAGFWSPGAGIIHQVVLENYAFPGQIILGTDSHTPNAGGLGACAIGVGGAEAVEAMAGLPWEVLYPRRIAIHLTGSLREWASPKDVIIHVAGLLTVRGGTGAILEYIGPGARTIRATGKATITNMGAETGATTSLFPADEAMCAFLATSGREHLVPWIERYRPLLSPDPEVEQDPATFYDRVLEVDLSALEPHLAGPHSPDRAFPVSQLPSIVAAHGYPDELSAALIGSCTNSSYEDMSRAARVAARAQAMGLRARVPFFVSPGSEKVRLALERDGQLEQLRAIGATVLSNACGPCIGQWRRDPPPSGTNSIVTSYNRNFPGRNDANPDTLNFLASPEVVTCLAISGRLSSNPLIHELLRAEEEDDGARVHARRNLAVGTRAPSPAARSSTAARSSRALHASTPSHSHSSSARGGTRASDVATSGCYISPPEDGTKVRIEIDPASQRLRPLAPWPAWHGKDFMDLPVLLKARGQVTTDQISPAGRWLRYRGNVEKFSDNLLSGALNAFTGDRGLTENVFTGTASRPVAEVARDYRSRNIGWVIVGDSNYGEGSSREHAALSPRILGGLAVIARSFARIHESNLKRQGLLALTFADPSDYDRIEQGDRIGILELASLAQNRPVVCRISHRDGTEERFFLRHTYTETQLAWFRAGSSLNAL